MNNKTQNRSRSLGSEEGSSYGVRCTKLWYTLYTQATPSGITFAYFCLKSEYQRRSLISRGLLE